MTIMNNTHMYWEQVMTDNEMPPEMQGKVIDYAWLIQEDHGPFV